MNSSRRKLTDMKINESLHEDDSEFEEQDFYTDDSESDEESSDDSDDKDKKDQKIEEAEAIPRKIAKLCTSEWSIVANIRDPLICDLDGIPEFSGEHKIIGFDNLDPVHCFYRFFPESIFEHVAVETNRYACVKLAGIQTITPKSRFKKWKDISAIDMKAFVSTEIGMGLVQKNSTPEYYQDSFWLTMTPGFSQIMKRDQYQLIRSFLHFANNDEDKNDDRLFKIRPIIDMVENIYQEAYNSNRELSIDESMVKFKGRLFSKHLPGKPNSKKGIKVWSLCDSKTGFLLKFHVHKRMKVQNHDKGLGYKVVSSLLNNFKNRGYVVYTDNFYTSVQLYNKLKDEKIGACGIIRPNRKGLPAELKKIKMKRGSLPILWENRTKKMLACTWQDAEKINMISTVGNAGVTEVSLCSRSVDHRTVIKPNIQRMYNAHAGGVDKFDQLCATYPFARRQKKWYQTLWHFIIEVALVNAYICYNEQNVDKISQKIFREKVIDGLLAGFVKKPTTNRGRQKTDPTNIRLLGRHFPRKYVDKKYQPNCHVCSIMPSLCKKKGKGVCKRKQTTYYCADCLGKPALCVQPCFEEYHTKLEYKKCCQCVS